MKLCKICGDEFQENTAMQKYCSECGKSPSQARKKYEKAERTANFHAGVYDQPKIRNCKKCGKEMVTFRNRVFCSTDYCIECTSRFAEKRAKQKEIEKVKKQ